MSGPKIFHIVTREEIIAICEGHLARLDAALAEWTRIGEHSQTITLEDVVAGKERHNALRRLLCADRFAELQKEVPAEISFIQLDAQSRLQRAARAAAEARQAQRRAWRTARMLLEELNKMGRAIPDELRQALEMKNAADLDAAMNKAFALLSATAKAAGPTDRQRAIAERHGRDEQRMTLADWIAKQPPAGEGELPRIDQHLAELSALGGDVVSFELRASALVDEPPSPRRAMLADSLLVELAGALKKAREHAVLRSDLRERSAELLRFKAAPAQALRAEIEAALAGKDISPVQDLLKRANALITAELEAMAVLARRRAVLHGLASLGYEVTEGMATAQVENGRLVLRKAANPDYGVELSGGSQSSRVQVRVIGFGTPKPIIEKLNAALRLALADPKVLKRFDKIDFTVFPDDQQTSVAADSLLHSEIARWGNVIRASNIEAAQQ
jgi:Tripartite tricarboxylate transporter family receptor